MKVILVEQHFEKGNHTHLSYSIFVPVLFVSILTVASVASIASGYYHYGKQASETGGSNNQANTSENGTPASNLKKSEENQKSSFQDNLEELALRINALQIQATKLEQLGSRLVHRDNDRKTNFSISWDRIITKQQRPTKTVKNTKWSFNSSSNSRFSHQATVTNFADSIMIVPKNFLRKYYSHTQILPEGWPLKQGRISSGFGRRGRRMHKGVDIAAPRGTAIFAVESGTVIRSQYMRGYGKIVEIKHSDLYSTRYAHNSENLVLVGEEVDKGQMIALVGSTGRSTGPHVHFEVRQSGVAINPLKYLSTMDIFTLSGNVKLSKYVKLSKK